MYVDEINKKGHGIRFFRSLVGVVAVLFYSEKLIESPLSHGRKTPCCLQNNLDKEEIRKNHELNICELIVTVKLF